jgi:pyrroline-5-carboxylate reductase
MTVAGRIVLVGCGNMGAALVGGWQGRGADATGGADIVIVEPDAERRRSALARFNIAAPAGPEALPCPSAADTIVFAVKPQVMASVVPAYVAHARAGALMLSIAAGRTIGFLESMLGDAAIVRAMPNTPAAVGAGMTVACANARVQTGQKALAGALLSAVGKVAWVDDEALLDAVTAVSGSGPAYVFLFTECLAEAGIAAGLPPTLAAELARETVIGAARLLALSEVPPEALRHQVTSPGGTTAAALAVLTGSGDLGDLLKRAVAAATRRSRELAGDD